MLHLYRVLPEEIDLVDPFLDHPSEYRVEWHRYNLDKKNPIHRSKQDKFFDLNVRSAPDQDRRDYT
jgi:hypothetical protein